MTVETFDHLVRSATRSPAAPNGFEPYDYQRRMAEDGLPALLRAPTGSGKTQAAVLGWLFRRRYHTESAVRAATPRRLVMVLPMRVLVEQSHDVTRGWLTNLGLTDDVGLYLLRGGEGKVDGAWRERCDGDTIIIGTLDMVLSRALHRGYAMGRHSYTVDFGLLNNDVQYVVDEVQLFGPALATTRQLDGLRRKLGTVIACRTTWMSATIDERELLTVDNPSIDSQLELADADRSGPLRGRLEGVRLIRRLEMPDEATAYAATIAEHLYDRHRPESLTLAVFNTVRAAREVADLLRRRTEVPVTLLHSRFRPPDRRERLAEALAAPSGAGRIVVTTQVLEAGVDISAAVLLTQAATWPSVVQRAGRCNRDGLVEDAELWWAAPPTSAPYSEQDVAATVTALTSLEGRALTGSQLSGLAVPVEPVSYPVLRRRDVLDLFDTTPDLAGNDIDISRFLRDADDLDVQLAWRPLSTGGPEVGTEPPVTEELCPAPVGEVRAAVKGGRSAWTFDPRARAWRRCRPDDVRPGAVLLLAAQDGGYSPANGWDPRVTDPVPAVSALDEPDPLVQPALAYDDEPGTVRPKAWVTLHQHLEDVEAEASRLFDQLVGDALPGDVRQSVLAAGRLHDIGKAHHVWQDALLRQASDEERHRRDAGRPWAKSDTNGRLEYDRPGFRHELASAVLLEQSGLLDGMAEPELVRYLVAAHHGRVRLGLRPAANEPPGRVLGLEDGDQVPAVDFPGGRLPAMTLRLSGLGLGDADGAPSYTDRALWLRDRTDLGPFRLGYLEAVVRLADWLASAKPGGYQ